MLRFLTAFSTVLILSCLSIQAAHSQSTYISGFLGFNLNTERSYSNTDVPVSGDLDFSGSSPSFGGALGLKLNDNFRVEAEIGYRNSEINGLSTSSGSSSAVSGDVQAVTFMLNGYYDFDLNWPVSPFIGVGAGIGYFDTKIRDNGSGLTQNSSGDDYNFVYQLSGGLRYPLSDDMNISGAYRYMGSADIGFDKTTIDYSAHEIRIGIDYQLPIMWDQK